MIYIEPPRIILNCRCALMPRINSPSRRLPPAEEIIFCFNRRRQAIVSFPTDLTLDEVDDILTQLIDYVEKRPDDNLQQRRQNSRDDRRATSLEGS